MTSIINYISRRKFQLLQAWNKLTGTLWFRPGSWMVLSIILASVIVTLDSAYLTEEFWEWAPWFMRGNASGARTMLGSISSAMLTVASLAFSLMMLTVVQTANAYSPRIINQFLSDPRNQNVLGILLGTFLYSLLVLRAVNDDFIPLMAVNFSIVAAIFATVALVSFISHVAQSLKVSKISEVILTQAKNVLENNFPEEVGQPWSQDREPVKPEPATIIYALKSGYLQLMDGNEQLSIAAEKDIVIEILNTLGDHILEGVPMARVWPEGQIDDASIQSIQATIVIGNERTDTQDARFAIRQLVDIALRALSPGINDPTTARDMINALKQILSARLHASKVSNLRADESGKLRLIFPLQTFDSLLKEAFLEILQHGASDFTVGLQLLKVIQQLHFAAKEPEDRDALWQMVGHIVSAVSKRIDSEIELELLNKELEETKALLERPSSSTVGTF